MPYLITTTRPAHRTRMAGPPQPLYGLPQPTRRAVATLDEAREAAAGLASVAYEDDQITEHLSDGTVAPLIDAAWNVPEAGGTIGPLADGTVIEVAQIEEDQLRAAVAHRMGGAYWRPIGAILNAYNAQT